MKKGELNIEHTRIAHKMGLYLRKHKTISREDFLNRFYDAKGWKGYWEYDNRTFVPPCKIYTLQNYVRFIAFLINHNIMTKVKINGFVIFIATQKCAKSKEKNWFKS